MADIQHKNITGLDAAHPPFYASESDPGASLGAYRGWFKPSTGEAWIRNAANTDWIALSGSGGGAAADITFDPSGGVGADDVQAAIEELDSEKASASDLTAHTADTSDAHDASAISIVDAGTYFTGTDVEAALQEIGAGGIGGGGASDLDDLGDVDVTTTPPTDGQALIFDDADDTWKPGSVALDPLPTYTVSNATTDRTYDADATSIDELADVLGTLIDDIAGGGVGGGGGGGSAWETQTGAGSMFIAKGNGDPTSFIIANSASSPSVSPSAISTTVARLVRFRLPKTLVVAHLYVYTVNALTGIATMGIYPATASSSRLWQSGAFNSVATGWVDITANTPFTINANTDYYMAFGVTAGSASILYTTDVAPYDADVFGADDSPIGGKSIGIPSLAQFTTTAGAMPSTLPTVTGQSPAWTGTVPYVFLEGTAS